MNPDNVSTYFLPFIFIFSLFLLTPFIFSSIISKIATKKRKKLFPDELQKTKKTEKEIFKTIFITMITVHILFSCIIVGLNLLFYYPNNKIYEDALIFYPSSLAYMFYSFVKANLTAAVFSVPYYIVTLILTIRKNKKNNSEKTENIHDNKSQKEHSDFYVKLKHIADFIVPISVPLIHILIFCYRQCLSFIWLFATFSYCADSFHIGLGASIIFCGCMLCYIIPFVHFIIITARIKVSKNNEEKENLKKCRKNFFFIFALFILFTAITLLACTSCLPFSFYEIPNYFMTGAEIVISDAYGLSF